VSTNSDSSFDRVQVTQLLNMSEEERDALPYGVIGIDRATIAQIYNRTESQNAGLSPEKVLGAAFFDNVAQCMNNFMVAQRFEDEPELDAIVPFVLTLRMRPTPVQLRLLATAAAPLRFILIER
jgi:photoactive yellow protein